MICSDCSPIIMSFLLYFYLTALSVLVVTTLSRFLFWLCSDAHLGGWRQDLCPNWGYCQVIVCRNTLICKFRKSPHHNHSHHHSEHPGTVGSSLGCTQGTTTGQPPRLMRSLTPPLISRWSPWWWSPWWWCHSCLNYNYYVWHNYYDLDSHDHQGYNK